MIDVPYINERLLSNSFIKKIYYFREIDSTNEFCKKLINEDDILAISEFQSGGKGRFNRIWESDANKNLTFSIKKRIVRNYKNIFSINFFVSYFLLAAIEKFMTGSKLHFTRKNFELKWPNDILYEKKKLCGILIESNIKKHEFIIGIGLNVNQSEFKPYKNYATSLRNITGNEIELSKLIVEIINSLSENILLLENGQENKIYKLWKNRTTDIGKMVEFTDNRNQKKIAKIININEDGSIKLKINNTISDFFDGEIKIIHS